MWAGCRRVPGRQNKKLLEGAGIQQAYQEVEAGVVVRNEGKESHFFLAQAGKVQLIRGGEGRHRGKIEFLQAGRQRDLNGFQRFGRAGTVILVILHGDVVRGTHFQPVKQLVQGGLVGVIVLPHLAGTEHFHDHGEIFLILRRFVPQVKHQRHEEHTGRRIPEGVVRLAPFRGGGFEQVRHHLLHIVVGFQIGKGIVAVAFLHVQKIHHLDLITHPFQQAAAVAQQLALTVQNKKGRIALADVHFGIEAAFSRSAASHHQGVEVAAVFSAIQPHADMLGENAVFEQVPVPVFLIHGPRIAPFGGTVFFTSSVIAPGRKINANAQPIGGNKMRTVFTLSSHHTILNGLFIAAGRALTISESPPEMAGAISRANQITGTSPRA